MNRSICWFLHFAMLTSLLCPAAVAEMEPSDQIEGDWKNYPLSFVAMKGLDFTFTTCDGKGVDIDGKIPLPSKNGSEFRVRETSKSLRIDTDSDGKADVKIKGWEEIVTLQVSYGDGYSGPYTIKVFREIFRRGDWYFVRHCYMTGKVGDIAVYLIDDDSDGRYGEYGEDAIAFGQTSYASPLGRVVNLGGKLYEVKVNQSGTVLSLKEYEGPTGRINVVTGYNCKGRLSWAVFSNGNGCFFDLANGSAEVEVPVGEYVLHTGCAETGSQRAFMAKGNMKPFKVEEDNTTVVSWGMPLKIDFTYTVRSGNVGVEYSSIKIFGSGGEEYVRFGPRYLVPKILVRCAKTGKKIGKARWSMI